MIAAIYDGSVTSSRGADSEESSRVKDIGGDTSVAFLSHTMASDRCIREFRQCTRCKTVVFGKSSVRHNEIVWCRLELQPRRPEGRATVDVSRPCGDRDEPAAQRMVRSHDEHATGGSHGIHEEGR